MAKKVIFGIVFALLTGLIVFTSLNTGAPYDAAGGAIGPWVNEHLLFNALSPVEVKAMTAFGAKFLGHFSLYALEGLFLWLFLRQFNLKQSVFVAIMLCFGVFIASLGEVIQIFVDGRFPSLADVIMNFGGYALIPVVSTLLRVNRWTA